MEGAHLRVLHAAPVHHLLQCGPRISLETGRVRHGPDGDLGGSHHPTPGQNRLSVQVEGVSGRAVEGFELNAVGFVEQRRRGRVLDQRQVVPRVIFLENFFAECDEEDDECDDDEEHHGDANQLLLTDHGVAGLHVGHHHGSQPAALAHEARGAVAVEGAVGVDADSPVLTLSLWITAITLVHVFLTAAGHKHGRPERGERRVSHSGAPPKNVTGICGK